jgi:N-acetyl-1-D-myo-inositol-2-amino-2-deoxy-alpha-D-glucopyranoside deacetylase
MSADVSAHLDGVSVLGVFAHPDDESLACGALLGALAERGARTALLCLTRGEAGPGGDGGSLADVRSDELRQAASVLGVADLTILEHEDGMLPFVESDLLERDIAAVVRRVQPEVVVTFDLDGLYWHPDHVAVHERVTAVVAALGDTAPALWYVSMPEGAVRSLAGASPDTGLAPLFGIDDPDAFGALAPAPTVVFTDERAAARKVAALLRHRSQTAGTALALVDARDAARLLATEHYRRADIGGRGETIVDRLALTLASTRG